MKKHLFLFFLFSLFSLLSLVSLSVAAEEISVTIYNSNLGVVSEIRSLQFEKGVHRLAFTDVPASIDATSVQFELVSDQGRVTILEQNYAYDLVSPDKIYQKYLDRKIELIDKEGHIYTGTLLAFSGGAATLSDKSGGIKIISMSNIAHANFPELPEGMITRPTLFWLYNSTVSGQYDGRISYQTSGMNWQAEYVGVLDESDKNLDLSGWASITNNSGKTFTKAKLRLIAGDINRVNDREIFLRGGRGSVMLDGMMAAPGFEEKQFFEYHMYTLPRKATLANREIKQLSLFDPAHTGVEKVYRFNANSNSKEVKVAIKFKNSEANGMGMPLPAGRIRMFKADDDGTMVLLGEDRIKHTPRDEELNIAVGTAFDIVAEHNTISRQIAADKVEDITYEIELRNHKAEPVTVEVLKSLWGFWEITESSLEFEKKNANQVIFYPKIPADSSLTIRLTVRYTHR